MKMIKEKGSKIDDYSISPRIRQVRQITLGL